MPPKPSPVKIKTIKPHNLYEHISLSESSLFSPPTPSLTEKEVSTASIVDQVNSKHDHLMFGITNIPGDACGRRVVARKDISRGITIIVEESPLWLVSSDKTDVVCHACGDEFKKDFKPIHDTSNTWAFCSSTCQESVKELVSLEETLSTVYEQVAEETQFDLNLLRIAVRFVLTKSFKKPTQSSELITGYKGVASVDGQQFMSSVFSIDQMVPHANINDEGIRVTSSMAARMLWPMLPGSVKCALYSDSKINGFIEDLLQICGRVNANIHGLHLSDAHSTSFGIGLYPICAMFNHSCFPNCVFINDGPRLLIKCVRDIKAGEELFVNYICLGQNTISRRMELLNEKSFMCRCIRCTLSPTSIDEFNHLHAEVLLAGIRVKPLTDNLAAKVNVADIISSLTQSVSDISEKPKGKKTLDDLVGAIYIPYIENPSETSSCNNSTCNTVEEWAEELSNQTYVSSLDDTVKIPFSEVKAIENRCVEEVNKAIQAYTSHGITMALRKKAVDTAYLFICKHLAPGHELFFTLLPLMVNVYSAIGDYRMRMEYAVTLAILSESFMPNAFYVLGNTFEGCYMAADRFEKEIKKMPGSKGILMKKQHTVRIKQVKEMYTAKHLLVLETCYGTQHPRYQEIFDKIKTIL